MSDIYSAPSAELQEDNAGSVFGSLEKGIAGDYELSVGGVFSEARAKLKGSKGIIWVSFLLMMLSFAVIQIATEFVLGLLPIPSVISAVFLQAVITLLTTPISVGIAIVVVKLASDVKANATSLFNHYGMMVKLFLQVLLMYLLIALGFILLVLPGIYLAVSYMFASTLMVEKNLGIWEAMEASRKAVTHKWFTVFFTWLAMIFVVIASIILILIGLIWTIPLVFLCIGVMYKTIFGVEQSTLEND